MDTQKENSSKSRLRRNISAKNKEPIAAVSAGLLLIVLLIIFGIGVFMVRDYIEVANRAIEIKSETASVEVPKTLDKLETTVVSKRFSDGDEAFQPMPDKHFVVVDVDVVHRLEAPKWFSPVLETYVTDSAGVKYELSPIVLDKPFDAREYKIDEHATGELSYMVPKDATGLSWCYEVSSLNLKSCSSL